MALRQRLKFTFLVLFLGLGFCLTSKAQVRIIQYSDAHSSLDTIAEQLAAIHRLGQEFLAEHPEGEVVIYVLGDFTSINSYSQQDGGWLSFESLKVLKDLGYTVLFTPGNHDAFDWTGKIDGAELFVQQMAQLYEWSIPILAANIINPTKPFKKYLSASYPLRTLQTPTHVVGMTIENLLEKSNLSEGRAQRLFEEVLGYEDTLNSVLPKLAAVDVEQVILGVHQGHKKLAKLAKAKFPSNTPFVSHYLGADDHLVTAYEKKGALITDAGAYGSINVIDYDKQGIVKAPVLHVAINKKGLDDIDPEVFQGESRLNQDLIQNALPHPSLRAYAARVNDHINRIKALWDRPVVVTQGFESHKMQMKKMRTELGSLLAQTLVLWGLDKLTYQNLVEGNTLRPQIAPIIAVVNSSSFRRETSIPAGPLTELEIRDTYPYLNEATLYKLKGQQIIDLIKSIRETYSGGDPDRYTPQMSFNVRDHKGQLQVYVDGKWSKIKKNHMYLFAIDGWLSNHRFGQSFQDPLWIKILSENIPVAIEVYQDILVSHINPAVQEHESLQCVRFLEHGFTN